MKCMYDSVCEHIVDCSDLVWDKITLEIVMLVMYHKYVSVITLV